ncbi:hypothetical protein E1265_04190 [Streptomyces sp. 8K308]|uniref:hypothetical protein n=1 Tax=Streptomyces sp. 8K308 TaxID=2530388 RepID=UPI001042BC1F|nr:hypothetical protein [Streptomyces sp. 8K308]TDC26492.1 hypothetical protein E1265_04190 [Streptomyces sp. 8K308]
MSEWKNGPELVEELRRAAEAAAAVPAPVEEMIRRGRALRFRRRVAAAGAGTAGVLAAVLAAGLVWLPTDAGSGGPDGTAPPAATRDAAFPHGDDGVAPVEVRPYERIVINDDVVMGLLPEGDQNYVVSSPEYFDEDIEAAKHYPGNNINPDSISAGYREDAGAVLLVEGAWRLDGTPSRIVVAPEGQGVTYPATVVTLAGESGWGVYYLDVSHHPDFALDFRVIAYDANGEVIAETSVTDP